MIGWDYVSGDVGKRPRKSTDLFGLSQAPSEAVEAPAFMAPIHKGTVWYFSDSCAETGGGFHWSIRKLNDPKKVYML